MEGIPTRETNETPIIKFLEENILSMFGFPKKIITYNAHDFSFAKRMQFFQYYNIKLGNSTSYYLQGNGLT